MSRKRSVNRRTPPQPVAASSTPAGAGFLLWAVALAVVLIVIVARLRLLNIPLERDEGEYAYAGQLILEGIPPYRLACNMKLPGTYAAYALILAIFGQSTAGIHLGFLLVNAGSVVLLYLIGRRLFHPAAGLAAAAAYALLSVGSRVLGTSAHATHFVVLPALAATWLLLKWSESRRNLLLFWSAVLYGVAFLMKQPGVLFGAFGGLYLLWSQWGEYRKLWRMVLVRLAVFAVGVALPFGLMCLILWRAGVFQKFWFWTFTYAREYASVVPPSLGMEAFSRMAPRVINQNLPVWFLAAPGLILPWIWRGKRASALFATVLLVFSFLAVCPGFFFREHYFVLLLPAVALLAGAAITSLPQIVPKLVPPLVFSGVLLSCVIRQQDFLFTMTPLEVCRELYGRNPFPEAIEVAGYINRNSKKESPIAVLGSEPEIYYYARRHSATGYIYTYALMEPQPFALQMQNEMVRDLEAARPEYIVFVNVAPSWLQQQDSPTRLFEWWADYARHYQIVGLADIVSWDQTMYYWDAGAAAQKPRSPAFLQVFRRKTSW